MKKRELYRQRIIINKDYSMQIAEDNDDYLNIYHKEKLIEEFKLNRKIYTLFKIIQSYTNADNDILVEDNGALIFGQQIYLYENVYMQINANRACLTLDFYRKNGNQYSLVYLTKLIYTTQKLFNMMLIPKKLETVTNYQISNIFKFIDMMEILSLGDKHERT